LENIGQHCTDTEREQWKQKELVRVWLKFHGKEIFGKELDGRISWYKRISDICFDEDFWVKINPHS